MFILTKYLHAEEVLEEIDTFGMVLTRHIYAVAYILLAAFAGPSWWAGTLVVTYVIFARSAVEAWVRSTVIDISFTSLSREAFTTDALVFVIKINTPLCTHSIARLV